MAQIYCVECRKNVVGKEAICPHCSCPITDAAAAAGGAKVGIPAMESSVQRLKGLQLMSFTTLSLSVMVLVSTPEEVGNVFWWISGAAGLGCLAYARIRLWLKQH